MAIVLPCLSGDSWCTDIRRQISNLFAYALTSNYSQSNIYNGNITSIPYLIAKYQNNQLDMADEMQVALTKYYNRYFPNTNIQVDYDTPVNDSYKLYISVTITVNGIVYTLAVVAAVDNGALSKVLSQINQ